MSAMLLRVAYDGTLFHGWAAQKTGVRTIEDTLRGAVAALDDRAGPLRGASRTDAGVHAEGQLAAFDTTRAIPPRGWVLGLNQHLPEDVSVRWAREVPSGYSPRFAAVRKRYRYRLRVDQVRDPHSRVRAWRISPPIDVERMRREAKLIEGEHDFAAFRSSGDERESTVRTMHRVAIDAEPAESDHSSLVSVVVEGDAFLYNMVRILVGTLVDVAHGRLPEGTIARALAERDRRVAGTTAPAHGLTLEWIDVELPSEAEGGDAWPR